MEIKNNHFHKLDLNLLQKEIDIHKKLMDCYNLRLYLIDTDRAIKNEYQKNEDEIQKIITYSKISTLKDKIYELEIEFLSMYNK